MGWLVALSMAALLYVFNKRVNPRGRSTNAVAIITVIIAMGVGCGLAFTFVGRWIAGGISAIASGLTNVTGESMTIAVPIAITIIAVGVAVADIAYDKKADSGAQFAAVLMPILLALVVGGAAGKTGGDAVRSVNVQIASVMTDFGGR